MNDDLISRQAVIDYLESISNMDPKERGAIIFSVELLPSVQPKTGRWESAYNSTEEGYPYNYCSECGFETGARCFWNYCPNCGAKMEMEQNEGHIQNAQS